MSASFRAQIRIAENNLPVFARKLTPAVASAMRNGMVNYIRLADAMTPVDTGLLRSNKSFVWPSAGMGGNPQGFVGYNQDYAAYVHDGTYKMRSQPWASNAANIIRSDYSAAVAAAIVEGLS